MTDSMGHMFRQLVNQKHILPIVGTINAYCALLAKNAGHRAIYLSGAGVANASWGIPDLGMTHLGDVFEDARRITQAVDLPLLVDIDTGWGHAFNIARTIKMMEQAGVAAVHLEDQVLAKRCGHRPNKAVVSQEEMGDRIKAAVDARQDPSFVIMARTDAYAIEGMNAAVERANYYVELGADMIFAEAMTTLAEYQQFAEQVNAPILANITEFGKTPLFSQTELENVGIKMALYPLSAFRAMSQAASLVYQTIKEEGSQVSCVDTMQTREELYHHLNYHTFEQQLDRLREKKDDQ
ncbi:methylisocitrate lyase [Legionella sp. W05-934-2]|jgi:methylisocitrate lyase|uniref:methylisocitrate lyase n=1 Tax=Legionella sp. W05-934-2 TaxID=1198649 RepID=UPI003461FAF8